MNRLGYQIMRTLYMNVAWGLRHAEVAADVRPYGEAIDLVLCGSRWAEREWVRFGLEPRRGATIAYPVTMREFGDVPPLGSARDTATAKRSSSAISATWLLSTSSRASADTPASRFSIRFRIARAEPSA